VTSEPTHWRRCSSCKTEIGFHTPYWVCSVSTCNRKRTGLVFCSVRCWDTHLPTARHRDAWAVEERSPGPAEAAKQAGGGERRKARRRVAAATGAKAETSGGEMLVVVSRLKKFVKETRGLSTSDGVMDVLSDHLRYLVDQAAQRAERHGRRTILDRDLKAALRGDWGEW